LERLVAAIGGTGDRDQMADAEMVEPGWLPFAGLRPAKWWLPV